MGSSSSSLSRRLALILMRRFFVVPDRGALPVPLPPFTEGCTTSDSSSEALELGLWLADFVPPLGEMSWSIFMIRSTEGSETLPGDVADADEAVLFSSRLPDKGRPASSVGVFGVFGVRGCRGEGECDTALRWVRPGVTGSIPSATERRDDARASNSQSCATVCREDRSGASSGGAGDNADDISLPPTSLLLEWRLGVVGRRGMGECETARLC